MARTKTIGPAEPAHVLAYPDFRVLIVARSFASTALLIQAVIVGWQVYSLRPDPLLLGLIGLAEAGPAIAASLFSGYVVDVNRAAIVYRLSLLALVVNSLLLFVAVWPTIGFSVDSRLALLFAGVFVSGGARSFSSPAIFSLVPRILPRRLLSSGAAANSMTYQTAAIFGPVLGGLAFNAGGPLIAFALPPILLACSLLVSGRLSEKTKALRGEAIRESALKSIAAGMRFAVGHRTLLSAMTLDMFSVLFGGAVAVLPMFADQVFKGGPMTLGILRSAPSVGSAIVALTLAVRPMRVISGRALLLAVAGFGAATIGFALSPHFWMAVVCLGLSGVFDGVSMVIRSTILQLLTPPAMSGRVSAVSSVFVTSSNEIGAFESGLAARLMGLIPSVAFGGAMTLAIVGATKWLAPELEGTRIGADDREAEKESARATKDESQEAT